METANQTEVVVEVVEVDEKSLLLYNDDVNTFDHVIDSLVQICGHEILQAEQCALIVHTKGKCSVKNGTFEKLEPMCVALLDRGLSAQIH
jgi:ATP-dependent Clp protease adaptor protein ClpS